MATKAMFCVLRVIDGPAQGSQVFLGSNQRIVIGRLSTADFSIPGDQHLSRSHLLVESDDKRFRVVDMGSSNGTFVNNSPISTMDITSGDIIRAGKSVFEVQLKLDNKASDFASAHPSETKPAQNESIPSRNVKAHWDDDFTQRYPQPQALEKNTLPLGEIFTEQFSELIGMFPISTDTKSLERSFIAGSADFQRLCECLGRLHSHLYFTINQQQVDSSVLGSTGVIAVSTNRLSEKILIVTRPSPLVIQKLLNGCYRKDAMVVIASREPIASSWFETWQHQISLPSVLASNLHQDPSLADLIIRTIDWIMFEPDRAGRFSILSKHDLLRSIEKPSDGSP